MFGSKPKTYSPEELKQRYSRKLFRGKFNPDVYYDKWGNPEDWADRIKRHCDKPDIKNYSECAKNYGAMTSYEPIPYSESKDMETDEDQKIIRLKLNGIQEAIVTHLNEIKTVRRLALQEGEVSPFSQETNEKIKGLKVKLEGLQDQLSRLDVVGINKMAKMSAEVQSERDIANSDIRKILRMYGGRKRKTRKKTRRK